MSIFDFLDVFTIVPTFNFGPLTNELLVTCWQIFGLKLSNILETCFKTGLSYQQLHVKKQNGEILQKKPRFFVHDLKHGTKFVKSSAIYELYCHPVLPRHLPPMSDI